MDYEKAYKEALKTAKAYYTQNGRIVPELACLSVIFPELKETEEERILNSLSFLCNEWINHSEHRTVPDEEHAKEILAWLEKHKEQKHSKKISIEDDAFTDVDFEVKLKPVKWSEEDDLYLVDATAACIAAYGAESSTAKWLKSLCRRLCWKPTKEEMEALGYAVIGDFGKIQPTSYLSRRLEELEKELNNL